MVIAIDGPAGAGKSTVSHAVARRLGLERLDTGAMYRAVAAFALAKAVAPDAEAEVAEIAQDASIAVGDRVVINGIDVTDDIRSVPVGQAVSLVAANPAVRRALVEQRSWADEHGLGVVEGREHRQRGLSRGGAQGVSDRIARERALRRHDESAAGVARRDDLDRPGLPPPSWSPPMLTSATPRVVVSMKWSKRSSHGSRHTRPRTSPRLRPRPERPVGYRIMRRIFTSVMWVLFRPKVVGKSNVPASGPVIPPRFIVPSPISASPRFAPTACSFS